MALNMAANGSFCSNGEEGDEGLWKHEMTAGGGRILPTRGGVLPARRVASSYTEVLSFLHGAFESPTLSERGRCRGGWVLLSPLMGGDRGCC